MSNCLKKTHVWHTPEEVRQARERALNTDVGREYVERLRGEVAHLLPLSWDALWDFVPPIDLLRTDYVNSDLIDRTAKSGEEAGCPIHGPAIFRDEGCRAWDLSPEHPWKVRCPIGGEFYPTNDFGAYLAGGRREKLDTHEKYVDDGTGHVDERGRRYFFVAYYNHHVRWALEVIWAARVFGRLHLLTGDADCARRGAILLLRTAAVYPLAHRGSQTYTNVKGKIFTWYEEYYATAGPIAHAYDDLFDYLSGAEDPEFADFLRRKGVTDPCFFVEHNFIRDLYHTAALTQELQANPGYLEEALSAGLAALGPPDADAGRANLAAKITQYVLHGGHYQGIHGLLGGNVWQDGLPSSNLNYNAGITGAILLAVERLALAGTDLWQDPRVRLLAESIGATSLAGMFAPSTGDGGGCKGMFPYGRYTLRPAVRAAYRALRDPRLARIFHALRATGPDPWTRPWRLGRAYAIAALAPELFDSDLEEVSGRHDAAGGERFITGTRHYPGYGIAFLESGEGAAKRSLSITYGCSAGGHNHWDRLNLELAWRDRVLLPDLGYPEAWLDKYQKWSLNTISHYCVMVDRRKQDSMARGALLLLGDAGPVHALEAENPAAYDGVRRYRRSTTLVDVGCDAFYVFDVFRVAGGDEHHWSFHGPPARSFAVEGVEVLPAAEGSLMGADVPFGALTDETSGLQFLGQVRVLDPAGDFSLQWEHEDGGACVRATVLVDPASKYYLCDGQPERRHCRADWLQYVIAQRTGSDLESAFAVVIDAWAAPGSPVVEQIELLPSPDKSVVAARITHADGADTIVSTGAADADVEVSGVRLVGRLGFVREAPDGRISMSLFDGTLLEYGGRKLAGHTVRGEVMAIDLGANRVAIPVPGRAPEPGQLILFRNQTRRTSFTITEIKAEKDRIWLGLREQITALRGSTEHVLAKEGKLFTRMLTAKYGTGVVHGGRFRPDLTGLFLASDNGEWTTPVRDSRLCPLDRETDPDYLPPDQRYIRVTTDTDFPDAVARPGSAFRVLEIAPGCAFTIPGAVEGPVIGDR